MKIAYISSIAYADLDLSLVKHLLQYADVTYFMLVGPNRKSTAIDLSKTCLNEGLTNARLLPELSCFSSFIELDKTFVVYSSSKRGLSWATLKKDHSLYCFLKEKHFDIVHLTTAPSYTMWELLQFRKKTVLTVHDPIPHSSSKNRMTELWRIIAFKTIKNIILLNQSQKAEFVNRYRLKESKKNIFVSRLGVYSYLQLFDDGKNRTIGDYILFFGNILSYKGLDYLFPAMAELHKLLPKVKLIVAGQGKYYFDITPYKKMSCFDIRNQFISDLELASLIHYSKFVVAPYVDATQSGVVMSAFAFNKPCVVTNVGGLPEMVVNGRHGIVIPPKDSVSLYQAMASLLTDEKRLRFYEKNIAEDYSNGLKSWNAITEELYSFYKTI